MLLIDNVITPRSEVCKRFGVSIEKITKRPEFEGTNAWKDLANPGKTRYPAGSNHLARFFVTDGEIPIEIRYAQTRRKDPKDSDLYIFHPVRVDMPGAGQQFSEDLDLAVFWYLHPTNALSPFYKKGEKPKFEFIDTQARADKKINDLDALGEAIVHAKTIKGEDARILAKGLGITGIHYRDEREVTAELMAYASQYPTVYLEKKNQRITMIEGQIEHFCDKEIFKMAQIGETRRWTWASGQKSGEVILDIYNATANAREALKNYILANLDQFLFLLNNMNESMSAREIAMQTLQSQGAVVVPEHLAKIGKGGNLPTNFNEAKEYLMAKTGKNQSVTRIGKLYKAVNAGEVTDENVAEFVEELCGIAETA